MLSSFLQNKLWNDFYKFYRNLFINLISSFSPICLPYYEKKRYYDEDSKYSCTGSYSLCDGSYEFINGATTHTGNDCKYLYLSNPPSGVKNKYVFDRWVSTIIFSCFIAACCIGLAIFGFLLFKSDSSGL